MERRLWSHKTQVALSKTLNITAYDSNDLVGCLRILTDGYFFGTITELLVLPAYQNRGIGSRLLQLAKENTPTLLYFGAQPQAEKFYEKNGCMKSLQSYIIHKSFDDSQKKRNFWFHKNLAKVQDFYSLPCLVTFPTDINPQFSDIWFSYTIRLF